MRQIGLLLLAVLAISACQPATTPTASPTQPPTTAPSPSAQPGAQAIDASAFTKFGGCGDVYLWTTNADGTTAITVEWQGAATAAWEDGGFDETSTLEEAPVLVSLVFGHGLDRLYCNDVIEPGMREDNKVQADVGTVRLVVTPDEGGFKPASHADATLTNLSFKVVVGTDEETWTLDELGFENLSVGWLAG